MARVTKINVGGTNYDIAHEGELKNSGFEVVTELPTTGLFEGREVVYQGKKFVYSTYINAWVVAFDEKKQPVYNVMRKRGIYEILGYDYTLYDNNINRSYLSKYLNYCNYTDDYLIEVSTDNETFTEVGRENKAYQIFNATNTKGFCVDNYKSVRLTIGYGKENYNILSFYINHKFLKVNKIKIDQQLRSNLSWENFGEVDFTSVNLRNYAVFFAVDMLSKLLGRYGLIYKIRFTIEFDITNTDSAIYNVFLIAEGNKYLAGINNYFNLSYKLLDCYSTVDYPITLNYDVNNIEPTQTGEVEKKANWVLRYLLQGVNWLKANKVALSVYNAKVTELMQADSDNNASIQSVSTDLTELSNGLATVARSGSYNDLTNKPNLATVATSGSYNDLTDKPTFSGSYNDLTDKPTLFSGSYEDLTDKPTLATVATSGSYNDLIDKPTFSGSYNDLTDKPNLATVATSGSYNDLTDKPTFSGSYNDLTDKPTLFSGSYNDLTDKPNLATVATSGSYNDLTDKPTFSGSYNDLTDKPTLFSGSYNDLTDKPNLATVATSGSYNDLIDKPDLVFSNIGGNVATAQITDGSITNAKLANSSMTLNGINCELGDTKTLPCIISFDSTLYKVRIYQNWLQIYRNGIWANLYYLLSSLPTECRYITDLSNPSWFDESVTEYELDNSATTQLLLANSSTNIANWIETINAQQITFNSSVIPCSKYNKGALDNIISNLKGNGYSVFVENDIDTILQSGNDWVISIKIKRFNDTYKAIIECYIAR